MLAFAARVRHGAAFGRRKLFAGTRASVVFFILTLVLFFRLRRRSRADASKIDTHCSVTGSVHGQVAGAASYCGSARFL
jgi:hypothetical protein